VNTARLYRFGAVLAVLAAGTHVYPLIKEWQHLDRAAALGILTSSSYALLQLGLVLGFLAAAVGLLLRNVPGFVLSIVSLLGVLLCYGYWFSYSDRWLAALSKDPVLQQHPEYIPSHSFGLIGGHWWDLVVLGLTITLLLVVLWTLIRRRYGHSSR
jgi:hypothetical protein